MAKDGRGEQLAVPLSWPQPHCCGPLGAALSRSPTRGREPTSSSCQQVSEPDQPVPGVGDACGSSTGPRDPGDSRELPVAHHGTPSKGQAEPWLLSEIPSSEAEGDVAPTMGATTGGWGLRFMEAVRWEDKGRDLVPTGHPDRETAQGSGDRQRARHGAERQREEGETQEETFT